jgi:hypothetical protein
LVIGTTYSLYTTSGLEYSIAQHLIVVNSNTNHFHGDVISYSHSTGELVLEIVKIDGSGSFFSWTTNLDGAVGGNGTSGTSGTSGLLLLTGTTDNGLITLNSSAPNATVENNLTFNGSTLNVVGDTRVTGRIIGSASNNTIVSDTLIQSALLFLSNNC